MYGRICPGFISRILYKRSSWNCADFRGPKTKAIKISVFIVIALTVFLYHIIAYGRFFDGIACFSIEIKDGIPDVLDDHEHPPPKGKSIFFHETSCNKAEGWIIQINARQACAVESAANLNPNSTVYLLYTSPIRYPNVSMFSSHKYKVLQELIKYKNIKIRRVDLKRYTQNTPLENWFHTGQLNRSSYVSSHTSDVLRYLSLWKYGGTYMDLDVVLMKNLEKLKPNYAGAESELSVAAGIINFDHHNTGHHLAELCLKEIELNFKGEDWGYNGPGVITRVLNHICDTMKTYAMTEERCKGFNVLPSSAFYPIHWRKWKLYFDTQRLDLAMKQVNNSYAIHVWNKFSIDTTVYTRQSDVLYGNIARKYCPKVYKASGDTF